MAYGKKYALFASAVLLFSLFAGLCAANNWYQFQMDEENSGITGDEGPISDPIDDNYMTWELELPIDAELSGIDSVPLVYDDLVYVATADNTVYAVDKTTGEIEWETSTRGSGFLISTPAYGDNKIFVPTNDGYIYALDADTGDVEWSEHVSDEQLNTPVTYKSHKIYFGDWEDEDSSGTYYCYSDDGEEEWTRTSTSGSGYYWAGAAVADDYLIYGDDGSTLVCVDKDTGDTVDEVSVSDVYGVDAEEIRSSISYDDDTIYFTSKGGYCYSLGFDSDTGEFDTSDISYAEIDTTSVSTPAIYNDRLYVGGGSYLYCLDASDLSEIWKYEANGEIQSSPALSSYYDAGNGEVYIYFTTNDEDGRVYCLEDSEDSDDADLCWSYGESGKTDWSLAGVAISDGWVFYGTDAKYLFGLTNLEADSDSGSSSSSSGGSGGGDTGESADNIVVSESNSIILSIGNRAVYEYTESENCINSVSFDPKVNAGYKTGIVEVLDSVSVYAEKINGNVYRYVNIWVGKAGFATPENLENAEIVFKVPESWIEENNIDKSTITLHRYTDGAWEDLDTTEIDSEEDGYCFFKAESVGFSPFAITGEAGESSEDTPESPDTSDSNQTENTTSDDTGSGESSPGFEGAFAGIALMALFFFAKKNTL